jgi:hypothetical protein
MTALPLPLLGSEGESRRETAVFDLQGNLN